VKPAHRPTRAVRAEVMNWGLGDTTVDPGEVLLPLVTQSAARAERYAMLLEETYEAAERLKRSFDAGAAADDAERTVQRPTSAIGGCAGVFFTLAGLISLIGSDTVNYVFGWVWPPVLLGLVVGCSSVSAGSCTAERRHHLR
jgi:hypothetical protein